MNYYDTETLYKNGKLPRWAYYQLNGKSAQENYAEQKQNKQKVLSISFDDKQIEEDLQAALDNALNNLSEVLKID